MAELNPRFAEMQEKLDQPSCFGKFKEGTSKCGMCWFWPKCKEGKTTVKRGRPKKSEEPTEETEGTSE